MHVADRAAGPLLPKAVADADTAPDMAALADDGECETAGREDGVAAAEPATTSPTETSAETVAALGIRHLILASS